MVWSGIRFWGSRVCAFLFLLLAAGIFSSCSSTRGLDDEDARAPQPDGNGSAGAGVGGATGAGGGGGAGASRDDGGAADAGADGASAACTAMANGAPVISLTQIADIPPTLLGGVLTDGTYYMTSDVTYTGPGGASGPTGDTIRDEIIISNAASGVATMNEASVQNGGPDSFDSVTLTTSGTSLIIDPICPSTVGPVTFQFTATASTLTVEYMDKVVTFEKQ